MVDPRLRATVADYARRLHARGWVANHDGNVTARLGEASGGSVERTLATPTATSKADIEADGLLVVDGAGRVLQGGGKVFSEIGLHLAVYRARPDVHAVVHAHPPHATGLAVAGSRLLETPFIPEAVVSLGPSVPTVPFAPPGDAAARALEPFVGKYDAVLLENHGVLAWGRDVEQAYLRLELVEHLARIALVAQQAGGVRPVPASLLPALLESRRKAGLGMAAEKAIPAPLVAPAVAAAPNPSEPRRVIACAPPPPGSDVVLAERRPKPAAPSGDLAAIIREEIVAALKK